MPPAKPLRVDRKPALPRITYTLQECEQALGISRQTILSALEKAGLQIARIGGRVLVRRDDLEALVRGSLVAALPPSPSRLKPARPQAAPPSGPTSA